MELVFGGAERIFDDQMMFQRPVVKRFDCGYFVTQPAFSSFVSLRQAVVFSNLNRTHCLPRSSSFY